MIIGQVFLSTVDEEPSIFIVFKAEKVVLMMKTKDLAEFISNLKIKIILIC